MMAELVKELNLSEYHFTPGSFRAGGATLWASMGVDIARLRFWGRWAAEASVAHYVQEASAYMIINQLSFSHLSKLELAIRLSCAIYKASSVISLVHYSLPTMTDCIARAGAIIVGGGRVLKGRRLDSLNLDE
jgi:hypothetical protein